jgi:hypothetical protein
MNSIVQENPYGPLSAERLEAFEESLGKRLPNEYREYLLNYNGGEFEKIIFPGHRIVIAGLGTIEDEPSFGVHHMYGLHDGPEYNRLEDRFEIWRAFDLEGFRDQLQGILRFADTTTGDALLLDLNDGSVWFFDPHDVTDEPNQNLRQYMYRLSSNFDEFVAKLISKEEEEVLRAGDPVYEEFKQRLEGFKRERKQETGNSD